MSKLQYLDLGGNQLSGKIPAELGNLANLEKLFLNHFFGPFGSRKNQLSGEIPAELGNLANLTHLWLSGNQLSGEIPAELGNLANLTHLWLSGNQLTGEIPAELTKLQYLDLAGNQLSGEIPAELGNLTNLWYLDIINHTGLVGCLPSNLQSQLRPIYAFGEDWRSDSLGGRSFC